MKKLYVLIDNGHGKNTPGKRKKLDNGQIFYEYQFAREAAKGIYERLKTSEIFVPILITPEEKDIVLAERVKRINNYCKKYGANNCVMISIHCDALGDGNTWQAGRGWAAWTTKGKTISDNLAECLYEGAEFVINQNKEYIDSFKDEKKQKPIRMDKSDNDKDYEANYYIIKGANCAAVLTENFFMTNKKDVAYLMSPRGLNDVICIHIKGIENYYKKYKK